MKLRSRRPKQPRTGANSRRTGWIMRMLAAVLEISRDIGFNVAIAHEISLVFLQEG